MGGSVSNRASPCPIFSFLTEQLQVMEMKYYLLLFLFSLEQLARFLDWSLGEGPCDCIRMLLFNIWLFNHYAKR